MRAPFNKTCDFLTGPGTTSPYNRYIVGAPCRLIDNPLFLDQQQPQAQGTHYVTVEIAQPAGPEVASLGSDKWSLDVAKADRIAFSSSPQSLWKVLHVVACTGPDQSTYWRATIALTSEVPLSPCQTIYRSYYDVTLPGLVNVRVYRVNPVIWIGGTTVLQAETTFPGAPGSCISLWFLLGGGAWSLYYNGQGNVNFNNTIPGGPNATVVPGPV